MGTYLMMLYVSVEQELAVKDMFIDRGWGFKKPDLRMTTDEVGPLTECAEEHVLQEPALEVVVEQEQPVENNTKSKKAATKRRSKPSPASKAKKNIPKLILRKKDKKSSESAEFQEILEEAELIAGSVNQMTDENDSTAGVASVKIEQASDEEADDSADTDSADEENSDSDYDVTPATSKLDDSGDTSASGEPSTAKKRKISKKGSTPNTSKSEAKTDTEGCFSDAEDVIRAGDTDNAEDSQITPYQTRFQCDLCKKIYATKYGAQRHLKSHESGLVRCCDCHTYYRSREELEDHRKLRHPAPMPCAVCGATFTRKSALNFHISKYHDESYQGKYHCSYKDCNRIFHREKDLNEHTNIHMGIKPHMCEKCGKLFTLSDSMFRHKKVCVENFKYKCVECGKEYASSGALSSHKNSAHLNKLYPCSCGRVFKHHSGLIKHKKVAGHPGVTETPKTDGSS